MSLKVNKQKACNKYEYDNDIGGFVAVKYGSDYISNNFSENMQRLQPDGLVLDIGCGRGSELRGIPCRKIGLDISKVNLKYAKVNDPSAHLVLGDAENLPFASDHFDAVIMVAVVHHIPDHWRLFREVHRVLKENGQLLIVDNNADSHLLVYPFSKLMMFIAHRRGHHAEGLGMPLKKGVRKLSSMGFLVECVEASGGIASMHWNNAMMSIIDLIIIDRKDSNSRQARLRFVDKYLEAIDKKLDSGLRPRFLQRYRLIAIKRSLGAPMGSATIKRNRIDPFE